MSTYQSDRKIIVSKDRVEFFSSRNFYTYGKSDVPRPPKSEKKSTPAELYSTDEDLEQKRLRYIRSNRIRSQNNLIRLVNANKTYDRGRHSFLTLTYKEDIRDIKKAQRDFAKFIQRLNYSQVHKKTKHLRYVSVIEFQDKNRNGVIHFHVILFDVPYIHWPIITKCWSHGSIDICARDKSGKPLTVTKIAKYMAKYMAKGFDDSRLQGKKKYFGSTLLERPLVFREPAHVDSIHALMPSSLIVKRESYTSTFLGEVHVLIYERVPLPIVNTALSQDVPFPRYEFSNDTW